MSIEKELLFDKIAKKIKAKKDVYEILLDLLGLIDMINQHVEKHEIDHNEPIIKECVEYIVSQLER